MHVLIIYDSSKVMNLPPSQIKVIYDQKLRTFLDSVTVMGPDGKTREYRIWDEGIVLTNVAQYWKDVMARPHPTIPWIVISTGTTGYEGPLPGSTVETIELIEKYIGK
jgi:hypothetical protein